MPHNDHVENQLCYDCRLTYCFSLNLQEIVGFILDRFVFGGTVTWTIILIIIIMRTNWEDEIKWLIFSFSFIFIIFVFSNNLFISGCEGHYARMSTSGQIKIKNHSNKYFNYATCAPNLGVQPPHMGVGPTHVRGVYKFGVQGTLF